MKRSQVLGIVNLKLSFFCIQGASYVTNDDLIAMALGESGVSTVNTDSATSTAVTITTGN